MQNLIDLALARHATIWEPDGYHHVFLYPSETQRRFAHAIEFFKEQSGGS